MPRKLLFLLLGWLSAAILLVAQKPPLTLDDNFNSVSFHALTLSPDGNAVVIGTERADWDQQVFRKDLWLYRISPKGGALLPLTQGGRDTNPRWSPDGRWIAFLSERSPSGAKAEAKAKGITQLFVISAGGGEAIPLTTGEEEVHEFCWASDSGALYFATRQPWSKEQKDRHKADWKDVVQFRGDERGDMIFRLPLQAAISRHAAQGARETPAAGKDLDATPGATALAKTPLKIQQMESSPDGKQVAFVTTSVSERQEKVEEYEVFVIDTAGASPDAAPRQLTHNEGVEHTLAWAADGRSLFFEVDLGSVEGKYRDSQTRLYSLDVRSGQIQRWAGKFDGAFARYAVTSEGIPILPGRLGTEMQLYSAGTPESGLNKLSHWDGSYEVVAAAAHSPRVAFIYSSLEKPMEVYVCDGPGAIPEARAITSFNQYFTERELPRGKPYRWKTDDGAAVEGMLMYPPGKFEAKHLPMFVFIHGGPADADGNHFETDWYQWDRLAATQGWLVFEPNYRGSSGYGDKFLMQIVPEIVSRPGKDILQGVAALVKDGIADSERLAVGGYSYGGYMTNWLITQSTQWKAAVTGAGAVEHVANWGNDDTTFDDAYFLGGLPWEAQQRYHDEAAIFQINRVRTPTHIVAGADDIRVSVLENYLLDRALHELNVPSSLLVFPGEGHSLSKNPWHGKIKVREELNWLKQYGGVGQ